MAAQSPLSPGKLKLSCTNLIQGLKEGLTLSHTHANVDKDRAGQS